VSTQEEWPRPIHWEATYEIALALNAKYAQIDLDEVSLENIFEWTLALPGFDDDPELANDEILTSILQEWYEERFPL
jgi:FeS assembly protein IscX